MPYKVLIAEDEQPIREGLHTILPWEEYGCEVVGSAADGQSCLRLLEELRPDILLSDIRMPLVNGLEIARHVREKHWDTKIIFLTGYNEFSYAQGAVQNDVFDYLLKPISAGVLSESVKRLVAQLEHRRLALEEQDELRRLVTDNLPQMRSDFVLQALYSRDTGSEELAQRLLFFDMEYPCYQLVLAVVNNYDKLRSTGDELGWQMDKLRVRRRLQAVAEESCNGLAVLTEYRHNGFLLLLASHTPTGTAQFASKAGEIQLGEHEVTLTFAIGRPFTKFGDITKHFTEVERIMNLKFYYQGASELHFEDLVVPGHGSEFDFTPFLEELTAGIKLIDSAATDEALAKLQEALVQYGTGEGLQGAAIQNLGGNLLFALLGSLGGIGVDTDALVAKWQPYIALFHAENVHDMCTVFQNLCGEAITLLEENRNRRNSSVVQLITEYLAEHYHEEVTLDQLARLVNMNPSYVSRLVKRETGQKYVDILLGIRIEKAKELLAQPGIKFYQVAELVGIQDSKYFSAVFKRATGITPTEYRRLVTTEVDE